MKSSIFRSLAATVVIAVAASCSKLDWKEAWGHHPPIPKCDLAAYSLTIYPQVTHPFLFSKVYDHSGRFVKSIDASVFNILPPEELNRYQVKVEYKGRNLYLVNQLSPEDTAMRVVLNKYGRPESATANENLGSYEFRYVNNRLDGIKWWGFWFDCVYDSDGNISRLTYTSDNGNLNGYFYTYDHARKARQQFYMDEIRYLDNGFTLLQYLGLFPELSPVNLRIRTRMAENVQPGAPAETGSNIWNKYLINHKLDAAGRLVRYDIADYINGNYSYSYSALLDWNCH